MKVWKKQITRWLIDGKQVPANTLGAKKKKILSNRFYGTLRTASGKSRQVALSNDELASKRLLRALQDEEERKVILGISDEEIQAVKPVSVAEAIPLYCDHLLIKGNSSDYAKLCFSRLTSILNESGIRYLSDLSPTPIVHQFNQWQISKTKSLQTCTHYVRVLNQFVNFLIREGKLTTNPLIGLQSYNAELERKLVRRAFQVEELTTLLHSIIKADTRYNGRDWELLPSDRIMLYRLAVTTGLRSKELNKLRASDIDFTSSLIIVPASTSKNKKKATLPLSKSFCSDLKSYISERKLEDLIFPGSWGKNKMGGKILKRDLKEAGIERIDSSCKVLDFQSLRYTFITNLARAGVHPAQAQRLARYSSMELTMNIYTQLDVEDLRGAVESLPEI